MCGGGGVINLNPGHEGLKFPTHFGSNVRWSPTSPAELPLFAHVFEDC